MRRSKHSLSHYNLLTCDMGKLVPCGLFEVLPGDTVQQATSFLIRVTPMLAPVMHPVHVRVHHWFVPHRIIWEDFEDFITGGQDGLDASVFPTITFASGVAKSTLGDYLGVPIGVNNIEVSALPFRAYSKIYNEFYRDADLASEQVIDETSGPDTTTNTTIKNVMWEKDYLTSSRPWAQKGAVVSLPLGTSAPVTTPKSGSSSDVAIGYDAAVQSGQLYTTAGPTDYVIADLSSATAATVNDLRLSLALQRYQEARARYGSRFSEYLRYLGVRSSDARLQRPEYLGGGRQTIQFSEVLQTAEGTNPVATLRGHGITGMRSRRYRRFFEEHGYVMSLLSVKPKTMYFEGLERHWNRRTKTDFWQKELQHIGQQEVLNKEVYAAHATPEGTFGYQDRYDEYRRVQSNVAGDYQDTVANFWHMARDFSSDPALNETFVVSQPTTRVYASSTNDPLWIMASHSIQARRLVAKMGTSYIF